jgi:hypothetical protein
VYGFSREAHKSIKRIFRQKARPEGSVDEVYLIKKKTRMFCEIMENFGSEDLRAWNEELEDISISISTFNTLQHLKLIKVHLSFGINKSF